MGATAPNAQRACPLHPAPAASQNQQLPGRTHRCCPFLCRRWSSSRSLGPGWQTGSCGESRVESARGLGLGPKVRGLWEAGSAAPMWPTLSAAAASWLALEPGEFRDREEEGQRPRPTHIFSISSFSSKAPGRSRLLPRTSTYSGGDTGPGPARPPSLSAPRRLPAPGPHAPHSPLAHRDPLQLGLVQQVVQLVLGGLDLLLVSGVHHVPGEGDGAAC